MLTQILTEIEYSTIMVVNLYMTFRRDNKRNCDCRFSVDINLVYTVSLRLDRCYDCLVGSLLVIR